MVLFLPIPYVLDRPCITQVIDDDRASGRCPAWLILGGMSGLTVPRPGDQRHGKRTTEVRNGLQKANRSTNRSRSINNDAGRTHQLSPSVIDRWRKQFREQKLVDRPSTREQQLQTENEKLKAKIGDLVMQNDQLKKMHDYAQRLRNADTSVITRAR